MIPYDKYRKLGDVHWKWYMGDNIGYRCLIDDSLKYFSGWHIKGTVMDIGCGDGVSSYILANKGLYVSGIDPDEIAINIATAKLKYLKFIGHCKKLEDFLKEDYNEYDYLYSVNTIEHIEDPSLFVEAMKRVKNFGVVVTDNSLGMKHKYHNIEFTIESLKELFKDYQTEEIKFTLPVVQRGSIGIKICV